MNAWQCSELTNGVFQNTYWGYSREAGTQVFENRVKFYNDFAIRGLWKSQLVSTIPRRENWLDHFEAYRARTGIVFICANYAGSPAPWMLMAKCFPLYGFGSQSYIRAFEGINHAQAFIRAASALMWAWPADTYDKMKSLCVPYPNGVGAMFEGEATQ